MKNKRLVLLWTLTILWTCVMFLLAGQNGEESGKLSGGLTQFLMRLLSVSEIHRPTFEHVVRKLAHFTMFALEGFLLTSALHATMGSIQTAAVISAPVCIVLAGLNEYVQLFFDGRSCELRDVAIDSSGAFLGIAAAALCYYCMKSRRRA